MQHGCKSSQHCQEARLQKTWRSVLNAAYILGCQNRLAVSRKSANLVFFSVFLDLSRDCVKRGFPQFRVKLSFPLLFDLSSKDLQRLQFDRRPEDRTGLVQFVTPLTRRASSRSGPTRRTPGERRTASSPATTCFNTTCHPPYARKLIISRSDDSCGLAFHGDCRLRCVAFLPSKGQSSRVATHTGTAVTCFCHVSMFFCALPRWTRCKPRRSERC